MRTLLITLLAAAAIGSNDLAARVEAGEISGRVLNEAQATVAGVAITAQRSTGGFSATIASSADGAYSFPGLAPGTYRLTARMTGFSAYVTQPIRISGAQTAKAGIPLAAERNVVPAGFWRRFTKAYRDDWKGASANGPAPLFRGDPAPIGQPPFPFAVCPMEVLRSSASRIRIFPH